MKTLNCTILAYEGPIFRAYLSILHQLGYKAKRIIKLYNGQNKFKWLPKFLRHPFLYNQEALRNNFWPKFFYKNKVIFEPIKKEVLKVYGLNVDFFDLLIKPCLDVSSIADECLYLDWKDCGWKSEELFQLLKGFGAQTYLFTGGGLVPKRILELPNTEFVHVHPGFLPYTRGADGILWSTFCRKKPGAACFYMVPQLDEGHLILTEEYDALQFQKPENADLQTLYRLVFSFYDPVVRALCLKQVLEKYGSLKNLPTTQQELHKGITFHFMHDLLKEKVLNLIFK